MRKIDNLYLIWNGGPGSGNHNPGQGQGIGKPGNKTLSDFSYDQLDKKSADYMSGDGVHTRYDKYHEYEEVVNPMIYDYLRTLCNTHKDELVKTEEEYLGDSYWKKKYLADKNKKYDEYVSDLLTFDHRFAEPIAFYEKDGTIDSYQELSKHGDSVYMLFGKGSELAWGDSIFTPLGQAILRWNQGANSDYPAYDKTPDGRKKLDEKVGLSDFIKRNNDIKYKSDKPIYRGITSSLKDVKNIKVGDTIDMRGPSSWSSSESVAKHFQDASLVRKGKEKILFVDKTKDRDAMPYLLSSHIDAQREVLYADVPFKVKSIEKGDHSYVIEVEQER